MVGCYSHRLNLEVKEMMQNHVVLSGVIEAVHYTMKCAGSQPKSAALLMNLTDLLPIMHNETRWSSAYHMLRRFTLIRDNLSSASEDENSDISINTSELFKSKAEKYSNVFGEINHVTKRPKYPGYTLAS